MRTIQPIVRKGFLGITAIVQLLFFPVVTFAETPSAAHSAPLAQSQAATSHGPVAAPGTDGQPYHFNKQSSLWENDHYVWDPVTKQTRPKGKLDYSYNPDTGHWDTTAWRYDAQQQKYQAQNHSKATQQPLSGKQSTSPAVLPSNGPVRQRTPAQSNAFDHFYDARISNTLHNTARSGDATLRHNTTAGNATSGNATAVANNFNLLQSSLGPQGAPIAAFDTTITGDIVGDMLLDPATSQPGSLPVGTAAPAAVDVNILDKKAIDNTITVGAASGNAMVDGNTTAGNATTGNASAIANVVNLVHSAISSGQSFVGNITIQGNFEGDILLPDSLKSRLLAANTTTPPQTATQPTQQLHDSQNISNTVRLDARSGKASAQDNTTAGNAQTGNAHTNLTVFNLTGRHIVGANALLVFVNVLGTWVGMIVDAPVGATAGLLGSDATLQPPTPGNKQSDFKTDRQHTIHNTLAITARSGDAQLCKNTTAGNARSGDARAGANLLNISNSQFSLADWFGILFINVLGTWHGSFGIDTPMGTRPVAMPQNTHLSEVAPGVRAIRVQDNHNRVASLRKALAAGPTNPPGSKNANGSVQILASTSKPDISFGAPTGPTAKNHHLNYWPAAIATGVAAAILVGERIIAIRAYTSPYRLPRNKRTTRRTV